MSGFVVLWLMNELWQLCLSFSSLAFEYLCDVAYQCIALVRLPLTIFPTLRMYGHWGGQGLREYGRQAGRHHNLCVCACMPPSGAARAVRQAIQSAGECAAGLQSGTSLRLVILACAGVCVCACVRVRVNANNPLICDVTLLMLPQALKMPRFSAAHHDACMGGSCTFTCPRKLPHMGGHIGVVQ